MPLSRHDLIAKTYTKKQKMKSTLRSLFLIFSTFAVSCGEVKQNSEVENIEDQITSSIELDNKGVLIDHKSYGEGSYTLLFVHGWCVDGSYWSDQVKELSSDHRIVTVDLPGFGGSGTNRENWSIEAYGTDINVVIEKLKLTNVILIGHSMGGDIILETALKNKEVIALIGVDNFKDVGVEFSDEIRAEIDGFMNMLKDNFSEVAPAYAEGMLFHHSTDSLVKNRVMTNFRNSDPSVSISSLGSLFEYALREPEQLSKLKTETLSN